ncbi:MAG: hypothetical protein HYR76_09770 [Ignavibacteria bacterium]|nr:hypothetical protein [Ignavibacteria bacterium]MBI3766251.1 hypothetical protein [Ignavibacteriales bacterium]
MVPSLKKRSPTMVAFILGAGYLVFGWMTLSHQYTFDAISYLQDIENTRLSIPLQPEAIAYNFFHSQHLLFSFFDYLFYHLWMCLGYHGSALLPAQILNLLEGAATLGLVSFVLYRMTEDVLLSSLFIAFLGMSYTFWSNTVMVSDHMASCLLAVILFGSLVKTQLQEVSMRRIALFGFLNGFAMLMHQANALLGAMFLVALLSEPLTIAARLKALLVYTLSAILTVAIPYLIVGVFILGNETIYDFVFWCFYYAMPGVMNVSGHYGTFQFGKLIDLVSSFGASIIGGFYWINRIFETHAFSLYSVPICSAIGLIAFLSVLIIGRTKGRANEIDHQTKKAMRLSAAWFGSYALLLFWWWPTYYQMWSIPFVAFVVLIATYIHSKLRTPLARHPYLQCAIAVVILSILTGNAIAAYIPAHDVANNDYYVTTMAIAQSTKPGDLIVIPGNDEYEVYVPYFIKRKIVSLHAVFIDHLNDRASSFKEIKEKIENAWSEGANVFVVSELRDTANVYADVFDLHNLSMADRQQFFRQYAVEDTLEARSLVLYKLENISP